MAEQPYLDRLFGRAQEAGMEVIVENRCGVLFLKIFEPELGTVAMWPAFGGSIEATARYAWECFEHLKPQEGNGSA